MSKNRKTPKSLILLLALAFLLLTSGCKTASHLLNPDTYSNDRREPWEKKSESKKKDAVAKEL